MTTICNRCGAEDTEIYNAEIDMSHCSEMCGNNSSEFEYIEVDSD